MCIRDRYNPFRYIHSEKDVLKLVNTLICNTKGEGEKSAEDFWIKSERLLYSAPVSYTHLDVYKRQAFKRFWSSANQPYDYKRR